MLLLSNRSLPLGGLGRRGIMVTGGIAFLIGALLQALAQNIGMLIAGRIFLGVGIGFANEVGPYASNASTGHRAAVWCLLSILQGIGCAEAGGACIQVQLSFLTLHYCSAD